MARKEGKRVLQVGLDAWTSDLAQQGKTDRTPHARPAEDSASAPGINVSQSEKEQCKLQGGSIRARHDIFFFVSVNNHTPLMVTPRFK